VGARERKIEYESRCVCVCVCVCVCATGSSLQRGISRASVSNDDSLEITGLKVPVVNVVSSMETCKDLPTFETCFTGETSRLRNSEGYTGFTSLEMSHSSIKFKPITSLKRENHLDKVAEM
jgi:hypothetical protein